MAMASQRPTDPILDELHAGRRNMLAACGGDLDRLVAWLREGEISSGHPIATMPVAVAQTKADGTADYSDMRG